MSTILSGVQPTGRLHIGNYFGHLKHMVECQANNSSQGKSQKLLFLADLHCLTSGGLMRTGIKNETIRMTAMLLAMGIDPHKTILFRQSDVLEHTALMWLLMPHVSVARLGRMLQWKEKSNSLSNNAGLLCYPILQAADIFLYNAETVVVGPDQKQHMELTIDISKKLNQNLGAQIFTAPKSVFGQKISSLKDPLQKMSKSAPDKDSSCIFLDDDSNSIRLKVQGATTDSVKTVYYDETDRPAVSSLIKLFSLTMGETDFAEAGRSIGDQGGCAQLKAILSDALNNLIQPINERYNNLIHNPRHLEDVLHDGSMKAREIAQRQFEVIKMHMMSPSVSG